MTKAHARDPSLFVMQKASKQVIFSYHTCQRCVLFLIFGDLWWSAVICGIQADQRLSELFSVVLCTEAVHSHFTLRWAVLTVLCIGFCHTGSISLCIDLFVFICVYFMCFCFILHSCCIIVSMVGWTWWDWSLIIRTYLSSVLWHCWLGHLTHKTRPQYDL